MIRGNGNVIHLRVGVAQPAHYSSRRGRDILASGGRRSVDTPSRRICLVHFGVVTLSSSHLNFDSTTRER